MADGLSALLNDIQQAAGLPYLSDLHSGNLCLCQTKNHCRKINCTGRERPTERAFPAFSFVRKGDFMKTNILIIDDDLAVCKQIKYNLQSEVIHFYTRILNWAYFFGGMPTAFVKDLKKLL